LPPRATQTGAAHGPHRAAAPAPSALHSHRLLRWARGSGNSLDTVHHLLEEYKRLAKVFQSEQAMLWL
jgi:signal recognition particle GTPase